MNPIRGFRYGWQYLTGEEETPFDGDSPIWVLSMLCHLGLIFLLAFTYLPAEMRPTLVNVESPPIEEEEEEIEIFEEIYTNEEKVNEEIGAHSMDGTQMAMAAAPILSDVSVVPSPEELIPTDIGEIEVNQVFEEARGIQFDNLPVKGYVGQGTTGASGAVDRITHEILLSLEERKTLVVWVFDQSGSLTRQRKEIIERFDRVYEELGVIEASGNEAFKKHEDKPLLTSVVAFGDKVSLLTKKPTDNIGEIKKAVAGIEEDDSGNERVFSAIYMATNQYKSMRVPSSRTGEPERNVMMIVFTDEAGDDQDGLDQTVKVCRRYELPVYVIGVPAPFGRKETLVKWVDPDPKYDQSPQWGRVSQGPETFLPERIKLNFDNSEVRDEALLDSGFGPFSLTRLCYETGGIYFAVHPNRKVNRAVSSRETSAFSAHLTHFFDPDVMRKYRPDYVSSDEYMKRVSSNKARTSLVQAAQSSWLMPMEAPLTRFEKRDEAAFVNALTDAQKGAAKLTPKVERLYQLLKLGEADREKETTLRWQAGYDLAMGRVMAMKIRTEAYNAMLAEAKRGLKFKNEKSNVWVLKPSDKVSTGSAMAKAADKAKEYLQRVADKHEGTPWALLASREMANPIGWEWQEDYVAPPAPPARNTTPAPANNNAAPRPATNETKNMIARPKPKRPPPKL